MEMDSSALQSCVIF
nr:unnamed protein product [Callosobruchus chinensis]